MYYYLSIGTNIDPHNNAPLIVKALCNTFGILTLFPFALTKPEDMSSNNDFLNSIAIINSNLNADQVKDLLVGIETSMGRNRSNPLSHALDRPADIDILFESSCLDCSLLKNQPERYLKKVIANNSAKLKFFGLPSISRPTPVRLCKITDHIIISKGCIYGQT